MEDGRSEAEKLCSKQACAIQYCLNRYKLQEKKCKDVIDEYNQCVAKVKEA
eukprot:CAMPEP_0113646142 /NCGR_PEP_ID=MMETSP0017_2-20120614/24359_1 /TAXON_ID=2856 /ORGANISM="Cylindrotheca closterium" /LENGTH=50 /DNA_ID=CAMNT_0000557991 /DNA_START=49 /DNA_END=198 /DNA_ORIENTATION=+ /assembly_acc=CAM_ASM_000147